MSKEIMLFKDGIFVGKAAVDEHIIKQQIISFHMAKNKETEEIVTLLYVRDMEYGIVIPEKIVNEICRKVGKNK